MDDTPKLSVIMSVYNGEEFLKETIDSVLKQTFKNFEFLVYDNASTDNTVQIIKSYNDNRIKLHINKENKGYVANLNTMMSLALGEYIVKQDADDIIDLRKFELLIKYLDENPKVGAVGYFVALFDKKKGRVRPYTSDRDIRAAMLFENQMDSLSMMRACLVKDNMLFDNNYIPCEDYKFWFEMMAKAELVNLPKTLLKYRIHGSNFSFQRKKIGDQCRVKIQSEIYKYLFNKDMSVDCKKAFYLLLNPNDSSSDDIRLVVNQLENISKMDNDTINKNALIYVMTKQWIVYVIRLRKFSLLFKPTFVNIFLFLRILLDVIFCRL